MEKFSHLQIKGYRRLVNIDTELRPLTVMIGANGVGKSSILEVFDLLASSAAGKLNPKLSELGGLATIKTIDKAQSVEIALSMPAHGHEPLDYHLEIEPKLASYAIKSESLTQHNPGHPEPFKHIESGYSSVKYFDSKEKKLLSPSWEHDDLETSLSQVPKMYTEPEEFRKHLASSTFYHVLDVDPKAPVRLPQPMRPAKLPGADGEDLVSCLFTLREAHRDRFETVEDSLRAAFPDFERLDFPPVAAGTLAMTWKDKNYSQPIFTHQLSEGTLRFLWLATLLQSPGLTAVTLLDEPEVSLHPELLSQLTDLFREASDRTQLIVATHSDRLIRFLQPREVLVMDLDEDGTAMANWADTMDLDKWLEDYSLDEVWRMGRMGGRA